MAKFSPGDRVLLVGDWRGRNGYPGHSLWEVLAEDTNRTPVRDPEPAYKLRSLSNHQSGNHVRYAYESCLAILPADGKEVEDQGRNGLTAGCSDALQEGA